MRQAAVLKAPKELRLEACDDRPPGRDEVSVLVHTCGVCGTDVNLFDGTFPAHFPIVPGHEFTGIVEAVGEGVTHLVPESRVVVDPNMFCGTCPACRRGEAHLCVNLKAIGVHSPYNGGFQERAVIPARQCHVIPDHIDLAHAALAEPLACCLHGMDVLQPRLGEWVLISGCGPIGVLMVQLARRSGARVLVVEPSGSRRQGAIRHRAHRVVPPEDLANEVKELTGGIGVDAAIECAGKPDSFETCCAMVRRGGRVLQFGAPAADATASVNPYHIYHNELTIMGAFINPNTMARALSLLSEGLIKVDDLITHTYPVKQLPQALLDSKRAVGLKIVIQPSAQ